MPDCACVYVDDLDCCVEFDNKTYPIARKVHICGECGTEIQPGQKYERTANKSDGDVSTLKTCMDCVSLRDEFFCSGYMYTRVLEDLREHILGLEGEIASECIVNLTPKARAWVCDTIEEAWEHEDQRKARLALRRIQKENY